VLDSRLCGAQPGTAASRSRETACCAGRPLPRWAEASGFLRRKCFFFSFLGAIFLNFRKRDCPKCLLEAGLWNLALWAVLDLSSFLAMGYDFFPGGGEKWACRQGRRLREPGWAGTAQERRSACFSAAGCDWEQLGFWPLGGRRRPNIFLFASEVVEKNRGWRARFLSIFGRFWVFGGPQRVMYICSYNFRNLKISKALCLFRRQGPSLPAPSAAKGKSEYFPF